MTRMNTLFVRILVRKFLFYYFAIISSSFGKYYSIFIHCEASPLYAKKNTTIKTWIARANLKRHDGLFAPPPPPVDESCTNYKKGETKQKKVTLKTTLVLGTYYGQTNAEYKTEKYYLYLAVVK